MTDAPTERGGEGAFSKLRRRKVVQWGIAYVAAAWTLLQVLEYFGETYAWPRAYRQIAGLALPLGLLFALVLAWYHGDKGEQRASRPELAILAAIVALVGGTLWWYVSRIDESAWVVDTGVPATRHALPVDDASIAVLPFVNMSSNAEQEYFSDGLAEEILNALAKVPRLRVIGRTSSFQFKGRNEDLRIIGEKLGAAHLLEGSVRRSGPQVRITAQLIRVADGSHLWSETYDRRLEDIFDVQYDIAQRVTSALQLVLDGEAAGALARVATANMTAYDLYLEGRYLFNTRKLEHIGRGLELLRAATERDPAFAEAQATFAVAAMVSRDYPTTDPAGFIPVTQAERAARRALALNPALAEAYAALGMIHATRLEWREADEQFRGAVSAEPYNGMASMWYGNFLRSLGYVRAAIPYYENARRYDPQAAVALGNLAVSYVSVARVAEAERLLAFAEERGMRHPTFCIAKIAIGTVRGDRATVQEALTEWFGFFPSWMPTGAESVLAQAAFDPAARAAARQLLADSITSEQELQSWATLLVAGMAGDFDSAFAAANFVSMSGAVTWGIAIWHPSLVEWRQDPRFKQLIERLQLPAYWRRAGWPDFCRSLGERDFECRG